MRGTTKIKKRVINPDPMYGSILVTKFVNRLMKHGKKTTAQRVVYGAFDIIKEKGQDPLEVFEKALETVGPRQEVKARRIGGAAYQVPTEVRGARKVSLAIRWILEASIKRSTSEFRTMSEKLAIEFMEAANNGGEAIKKKESVQRMADANKAFAHFKF